MKVLRASRMERCIGCDSCALACARTVHREISWHASGIRIASSGGISTGFEAKVCLNCDPASCVAACPTEALIQRAGGGVKMRYKFCINCGECARACPYDAIALAPETNRPYVCIHCGACVAFCPHECLEMVEIAGPAETELEAA